LSEQSAAAGFQKQTKFCRESSARWTGRQWTSRRGMDLWPIFQCVDITPLVRTWVTNNKRKLASSEFIIEQHLMV
jgi:hypothetical protein